MKYLNIFDLLAKEFKKANIPFVLIGGFAVNYYKVSRFTGDVDILIDERNFKKVLPLLEQAGYKEVTKQHLFARFVNDDLNFMDLDLMFVDEKTFSGILREGKEVEIEGRKMVVPSLNHLVALKLHSLKNNPDHREDPDLKDLARLIQENQVDVAKNDFRELCLKYGTQELYEKIQGIVKPWKS